MALVCCWLTRLVECYAWLDSSWKEDCRGILLT